MTVATPTVRYKTITPEEAHVLLKRSKRKNVPTKKAKIDQYARTMIAGKWDPNNSQAISLDTDGNIVNGHQRLMACVQAGVPFRTLYITGVPPETFISEDTGRNRDAAHFFALTGEKNYVALAAGARALYLWERGMWRQAAGSGNRALAIPYEQLQEELKRRPVLREAAAFWTNTETFRGRLPMNVVVALHTLSNGHPKAEEFWTELADRIGTNKKSPAWQLNRRIDIAKSKNYLLTKGTVQSLLTKAWNMWVSGEFRELVYHQGREKVPEPLTDLMPALLPPEDNVEVITVSPVKRGRRKPASGPPVLKLVPAPKKRTKKGPKLRGGLGTGS